MAEAQKQTTEPKSKRELFGERMKKKYPDREYADDEELFGQINDDYDEYDKELGQYKERETRLTELFRNDPRSARFITDMAKGVDPWISVIERLGIDGVTDIINDPDKQEEYAEANRKYVERIAKEESLKEEYDKNIAESMVLLEQIQKEKGIDDNTIDAAMELIMKITHEAIMGKFTAETIDMALKAINHEADVNNARTEGAIAGRNERIEEKLRKPAGGDGQPNLSGSNNAPTRKNRKKNIFDLAADAI